jgi:hypothetical protein
MSVENANFKVVGLLILLQQKLERFPGSIGIYIDRNNLYRRLGLYCESRRRVPRTTANSLEAIRVRLFLTNKSGVLIGV